MPKNFNVKVVTADAELEFSIQNSTQGKVLFDQVVKTTGLREIWYFGLQFTDSKNFETWLNLTKKVTAQDVKKETPLRFQFLAKYYPEDVSEELIQASTKRMFFLQVKESIVSGELFCSPETAILLASYSCQAKFGDYSAETQPAGFLTNLERYIPQRVLDQFSLGKEEWEAKIVNWYKELNGTWPEDAMVEYLKICQDLEMYGVNYFDIKNKKGTNLWLGVDALGVNVYEKDDRLTPKIGFPWSEIRNISFNDKKFILSPLDKKAPDFVFYATHLKINKRILSLCMGNHELYVRRRKPETIEVQQMRAQAKEEREARQKEYLKLMTERSARELAEKQREELLERLRRLEAMNSSYDEERRNYEFKMAELTRRLDEERARHLEIEEAKRRAEEIAQQLEHDKNMAHEERQQLLAQNEEIMVMIEAKQLEANQSEAQLQEMQQEMERIRLERLELEEKARRFDEMHQLKADIHEYENDTEEKNEYAAEFQNLEDIVKDRDEEQRQTLIEKNEWMQAQLASLSDELKVTRVDTKVQKIDRIHEENQRQGRDKFKTLKQIRQGNTKKRVDEFEAL